MGNARKSCDESPPMQFKWAVMLEYGQILAEMVHFDLNSAVAGT